VWKVTNDTNKDKLKKFENQVIKPLFYYMYRFKRSNQSIKFIDYLEEIQHKIPEGKALSKKIDIVITLYKNKYKKVKFSDLIDNILDNHNAQYIKESYKLYMLQNIALQNAIDTSIKNFTMPTKVNGNEIETEPWKQIFSDFLYKKYFADEALWKKIDGGTFTRATFHDNFRKDNSLFVCPYCDLTTTSENGNLEIEHFYPESKYPFLALNPLNLYSSCKSCNRPSSGKGTNVIEPITMPYVEQIGDKITFKFKKDSIKLEGPEDCYNNYIKLLELNNRYSSTGVIDHIHAQATSYYDSVINSQKCGVINKNTNITEYIKSSIQDKKQPFYFILSYIFEDYDNYCKLWK